jgi:uncharacterized lipoprotein YddW (UPF0748 family)
MRHAVLLLCAGTTLAACSDDTMTASQSSGGTASAAESSSSSAGSSPTETGGPGTGTGNMSEGTSSGETGTSGGPTQDLVPVGHTRELRAVWVASVGNINFPSEQGLGVAEQQDELRATFDAVAAAGLNTVILQVRPESDALYASAIEPWSRYITGTQGEDPGYDPLEFAVAEAHLRGLELHGWFNPYRAAASAGSAVAADHISKKFPEYAYKYGNFLWMDPGAEVVQDQLVDVITDVVTRYDIDGVHFDDYFYPYPDGSDFPDDATYGEYVDGGGSLDLGDWRRDNVNRMVKRVGETVAGLRPSVRWGISPFGIYRPGTPPGIQGLDQYAEIYSDPLKWMQEGWLDYLAPQLYWPSTQAPQAYGVLIEWWSSITMEGRHIFAGNYLSKIGSEAKWSLEEFQTQIELSREYADQGSQGNIFFHVGPILENSEGITDLLTGDLYARPSLTPPIAALMNEDVAPPQVVLVEGGAMVSHAQPESLRAWVVYRALGEGWEIDRITPASQASVPLVGPGTFAISAAGRSGVESLGVRVTLP